MADLPHRRMVCNSVGAPVEEVSDDGLRQAIADYLQENPASIDETATDPGDITVYFENGLVGP